MVSFPLQTRCARGANHLSLIGHRVDPKLIANQGKISEHETLQIDALKEAGCEKWFVDKMTGSKAERKGLVEALAYLWEGGYAGGVEAGAEPIRN
jgi:hypothetical protein